MQILAKMCENLHKLYKFLHIFAKLAYMQVFVYMRENWHKFINIFLSFSTRSESIQERKKVFEIQTKNNPFMTHHSSWQCACIHTAKDSNPRSLFGIYHYLSSNLLMVDTAATTMPISSFMNLHTHTHTYI